MITKYSLKHRMCINLLLKILPKYYLFPNVTFAESYSNQQCKKFCKIKLLISDLFECAWSKEPQTEIKTYQDMDQHIFLVFGLFVGFVDKYRSSPALSFNGSKPNVIED